MDDTQQDQKSLSDEFQNLQRELQTHILSRQKLESQQTENKTVLKEFKSLNNDANVYKLTGPVLLKQDKTDAQMVVDARLQFIDNEIKRVDKQIKELQDQCEVIRTKVVYFNFHTSI
ncbi:BgTH12-02703 [Blumeria graminis f. sp. triticale]|uniref:Bgt-3984 n=3 Tax=Blumeria graminis TaxID=34373 RepID=A0A9X9QDD2_BLUGR|nr:Subunit of the heterohexameric Gim-prefoldin protein complex [Blumeria graminis f. sp. tritici 96224]CAD6503032.1 BgTH12-02703 [Blumeria graminis f. sp. triticale]VDB88968.1 Bgt-3984 [Blumeria graminis f. sp. tritici]